MDILAAIKREERKLEKQLGKLNHQLSGVRAACESIGAFCGARSSRREEARPVGCWKGGDREGGKKTVGEG
jgi:hypothetical protein